MDPVSRWLIIGLCVLMSFFFSASETALALCNRFKVQIKADSGSKTAKVLLKVISKFDRALTAVLVGNNIFAIVISSVSTLLFLDYFKESMPDQEFLISLLSSISMSIIIYLFGDTLPKTIAVIIPDTLSYIVAWPIYIITWILTYIVPLTVLFELFAKGIEKLFRVKKEIDFTEEDFEDVVEKVADEGVLEEEQEEIIQSALDFADTNVKEVLTPRDRIFAISADDLTHDKIKEILLNTNYSRIPVYEGDIDNIIGVLNVKKYFKSYSHNPNVTIRRILQKPYFVSSNIMIDDLFNGFKKHHTHIAIVRNKLYKTIGMVTMEDVLEELVSDIGETNVLYKGRR